MRKIRLKRFKNVMIAVAAAGLLAACGGRMDVATAPLPQQEAGENPADTQTETMQTETTQTETTQTESTQADEAAEHAESDTVTEPSDSGDAVDPASDTASDQPQDTTQPIAVQPSELVTIPVFDGEMNETDLLEYVSKNKVTMLNFWGTFCGTCIRDMPNLAAIYTEYSDKGFGIVGVTIDAVNPSNGSIDPGIINDAEEIANETGVQYPIVYASRDLVFYTQIQVVPTTVFVDENGYLLTEPIIGARGKAQWNVIISDILQRADGK